jgi:flagellar motor switch protein FliG
MLEPENAAAVLALLPEEMQPLVVERIARLGPVTSDAVAMLDTLLSAQISTQFGAAVAKIGGPREAANLINLAAGDTAKRVLPKIGEANAELASKIEAEMFTFEMLFDLSGLDMGRLLRDVDNEALVDALKGLEADKREPFFAAMSSRAADGVRDDIELRGRLKREEVDAAQKSIVEIARGLADQGEITIGGGGDEFV